MIKSLFLVFLSFVTLIQIGCTKKLIKHQKDTNQYLKTTKEKKVILGNENFINNHLHSLENKRVGLLTNPSGVYSNLISTADIFHNHPQINLVALYGPEHGIRGAVHAGQHVEDAKDSKTSLPVHSLYGKNRKPTKEMLRDVDVLVIDIQDIGSRSYTFIYTMALAMEAAAEFNKKVIVLDRPNPLGGLKVEGNLVEQAFKSFVGLYPIAYRHGMTIGELAKLFNNEFDIQCNLKVIPMLNWQRDMFWNDTNLPWVPTSPHIPHGDSPMFYCATGSIGELHTIFNGVGYTSPFELIGAPWVDAEELANELNNLQLQGVYFRPLHFRPYYFQFTGENCQGVQVHIIDPKQCDLFSMGLHILQTIIRLYPDKNIFADDDRIKMFNKVMGSDWIMKDLQNKIPVTEIENKWQDELKEFMAIRKKYLIY